MNQQNERIQTAQEDWLQEDPIHKRLVEELYRLAEADDYRSIDNSFDTWKVLKAGVPLEDAVRAFLNSYQYKLPALQTNTFNFRHCIRIPDEDALPRDPADREKLLSFCDKNRISIIVAGSDDYHFYNLCDGRAYFIYFDYVLGSWDELRLEILPN